MCLLSSHFFFLNQFLCFCLCSRTLTSRPDMHGWRHLGIRGAGAGGLAQWAEALVSKPPNLSLAPNFCKLSSDHHRSTIACSSQGKQISDIKKNQISYSGHDCLHKAIMRLERVIRLTPRFLGTAPSCVILIHMTLGCYSVLIWEGGWDGDSCGTVSVSHYIGWGGVFASCGGSGLPMLLEGTLINSSVHHAGLGLGAVPSVRGHPP